MRKRALYFPALIVAVLITVNTAWGQVIVPPLGLDPLNQIPVPEPINLYEFVKNKQAAIQLGKSFFWDMQTGSDGIMACATCHFNAGADNRMKNTLNPGSKAGDTTFQVVGPNETLQPAHFPFHLRQGTGQFQASPVVRNSNDVVGSQGVRLADFVDVVPGSAVEITTPVPDPVFQVNGVNMRQVTDRNTPTVINAIFNFTQFWDGRATYNFNGETPFGPADPDAGLWFSNPADPLEPPMKLPINLMFASLASQAVGPPMSPVEMAASGRTMPQLGRKLLSLTPLAKQYVSHDDSVLGGLALSASIPGAPGLHTGYAELIQKSFYEKLWSSNQPVTITLPNGQPAQFTQMEANFAFFWGVSIQLYLATLVSDQTPFDLWLGGDSTALTDQQKQGFTLFNGNGRCSICHVGVELTTASFSNALFVHEDANALLELMFVADGSQAVYDDGFNNNSVTPTTDDIGRGGTAPFLNPLTGALYPLSFSARAILRELNQMQFLTPLLPPGIPVSMRVNANGGFKVPTMRNIELTGPYFHNGSVLDLDHVMDFYIRGGNFPVQNAEDLDPDVGNGLPLLAGDLVAEQNVLEFFKSLTDWRVAAEASPFDHPELFVPNGALADGTDIMVRIPATNEFGQVNLTAVTLNPAASPTRVNSLTVSGTIGAGSTNPDVWTDTAAAAGPVVMDGTNWSAPISGLAEGPNVITARVFDNLGIEALITATVVVDSTSPAVTLNPVTTPTDLATQVITGTREAASAVQVSVNGGSPVTGTGSGTSWSFSASLETGANTIVVSAIDAAGNTTELPAQTISFSGAAQNPAPQNPAAQNPSALASTGGGSGGGCFIGAIF